MSKDDPTQMQGLSTNEFDFVRSGTGFIEGVARYGDSYVTVSTGSDRPISAWASAIYGEYFQVLGVRPVEGRLLTASDSEFQSDPFQVVISERLRDRIYRAESTAVGRTVAVNGHQMRIVGVIGAGFQGAERGSDIDVWFPFPALGHLEPGVAPERLRAAEAKFHRDLIVGLPEGRHTGDIGPALAAQLVRAAEAMPAQAEHLHGLTPIVLPRLTVPPPLRDATRDTLRVLAIVAGVLLAVVCVNLANLMLFRGVAKTEQTAVRRAMGASSARMVRVQLLEAGGLGVLGAGLSTGLALLISRAFQGQQFGPGAVVESVAVDPALLASAVAIAVLASLSAAGFPVLVHLRPRSRISSGSSRTTVGRRFQAVLASAQVGLALALLVVTSMLIQTVRNLYSVDTGFEVNGVASVTIDFPPPLEPDASAFQEVLTDELRAGGLQDVALGLYSPNGSSLLGRATLAGAEEGNPSLVRIAPVSAGWFDVLRISDLNGVEVKVSESDWPSGSSILTRSLARKLFGDEVRALGQSLRVAVGRSEWEARIVAVSSDFRSARAPGVARDMLYIPLQDSPLVDPLTIVVRVPGGPGTSLSPIVDAAERALPGVPVAEPRWLSDEVTEIHAEQLVLSRILGLLSTIAIMLAMVGLYGVLAYTVALRTPEFGLRIALGATTGRIARMLARWAGGVVVIGIAAGAVGGYVVARIMETRLFGVTPRDMEPYLLSVVLLVLAASVSCAVPARRAMTANPSEALQREGQ